LTGDADVKNWELDQEFVGQKGDKARNESEYSIYAETWTQPILGWSFVWMQMSPDAAKLVARMFIGLCLSPLKIRVEL